MPTPTEFEIDFACGHSEVRDLSDRPAGKRRGFAKWLESKDCTECFKKEQGQADLDELFQDVADRKKKLELPDLDGTDKQVKWGELNRDKLIMAAHGDLTEGEDAPLDEDEFDERILEPARKVTNAGWWMDNKDSEPDELEELVTTALDDDEVDTGTENTL